jgi:hypothetical protein
MKKKNLSWTSINLGEKLHFKELQYEMTFNKVIVEKLNIKTGIKSFGIYI